MNKSNTIINDEFYYKLYLKNYQNLNEMNNCCLCMRLSLEKYLRNVVNYINNNNIRPEYVKIIDKLSTIRDEEKVIPYLDSVSVDYKILRNNLMDYYLNYRPDLFYTNEFIKKRIRDYLSLYETHKSKLENPVKTEKKDMYNVISMNFIEYINSPYSLNRFCFNKDINKTVFNKYISTTKLKYPELYEKFMEANTLKEQIKSETIENDVYLLLKEVKENPNFSIIDFLLATNYDVLEIVSVADNLLSIDDIKLFRMKIRPFRYINRSNERQINNMINCSFTFNINGNLITLCDEDKYNILEFIKQNNIPMSNETFQDACLKYLNNKLEKGCTK